MLMKLKHAQVVLLVAFALWTAWGGCMALAGDEQLDTATVRANLGRWIASQDNSSPDEAARRVDIQKVVPVKSESLSLFAVRLAISPPPGVEAVPSMGVMVFDASGQYRLKGMTRLATGEDLMSAARRDAMRFDLPVDFGRVLADFGGPHEVVLVSDAFCPHCRQAWAALKQLRAHIGKLRVVHLPLVGHEGAEALGWALDFAADKGLDAVGMADFAMVSVTPPGGGLFQGMDAALGALEPLFAKYPVLRDRLGAPEAAWELLRAKYGPDNGRDRQRCWRMGLGAVPCVFVDGYLMHGVNVNELRALLQ